jgi:TRL (tRNA-associated locus)-like protein
MRLAALGLVVASGCIYTNVVTPLAYRAPTLQEAKAEGAAEAEGVACDHAVLYLVAWGDAGYAAAVADAKAKSGGTQLADVRADTTFFNVLGVYQRACTRVTGRVVR